MRAYSLAPRACAIFFLLSAVALGQIQGHQDVHERKLLRIITALDQTHEFLVEIADEPAERRRGLSFRHQLNRDSGMLFLYDRPRELRFWMRDTFIPLDIIFVNQEGVIHNIHSNAIPMRDDMISSNGAVMTVLEINGGLSDQLGISVGDRVEWQ